ncbi:hypothetical protein MY415_10325 [Leptospira interrogans]|nr:hypothetical protein [Leptospira interrogans]UQX05696.1 hypothetical protein MY415_10325 [Leptospira interrogans]
MLLHKPVWRGDEGIFKIYKLTSGKILETFDYKKRVGEPYSISNLKKIDSNRFEIKGLDMDQKKKFIKTFLKV